VICSFAEEVQTKNTGTANSGSAKSSHALFLTDNYQLFVGRANGDDQAVSNNEPHLMYARLENLNWSRFVSKCNISADSATFFQQSNVEAKVFEIETLPIVLKEKETTLQSHINTRMHAAQAAHTHPKTIHDLPLFMLPRLVQSMDGASSIEIAHSAKSDCSSTKCPNCLEVKSKYEVHCVIVSRVEVHVHDDDVDFFAFLFVLFFPISYRNSI
jgi:hypothetical protein